MTEIVYIKPLAGGDPDDLHYELVDEAGQVLAMSSDLDWLVSAVTHVTPCPHEHRHVGDTIEIPVASTEAFAARLLDWMKASGAFPLSDIDVPDLPRNRQERRALDRARRRKSDTVH